MCGLAGIVDLHGLDSAAEAPRLDGAIQRLGPRGPDGRGRWADAHCALGHTRLKVIDLSEAAAQPMAGHGAVIAFNGEIYNFQALRDALEALGHHFHSRSDTEVLLAGWKEWGEALLGRLVGMFALALWQPETQRLVLARDPFGKKPLCYASDGNRLAFASDLVALDRLRETGGIDPAALRLLFTLRYLPDPWSIRPGVRKLPPGHLLTLDSAGTTVRRWYHPPSSGAPLGDGDLVETFDRAVADRLVADVPVGVFLSGGVDSALVAASMARAGTRVRSFTVGFEGAASYYEERPAARAIARHIGTDHTEISISAADALAAMDGVFEGLDEPFADSSAVPSYLVAEAARRHVTVVLSGDGADEVFGGYRRYRAERYAGLYGALPAVLRTGLIEPLARCLPETKTTRTGELVRRLRRFVDNAAKPGAARQAGFYRLLDEEALDGFLVQPARAPLIENLVAEARAAAGTADEINAMLAADIAIGLPSDMLVKVDRMSMANGLEVRCPFLDHRLVALAAAIPGHRKVGRKRGKQILSEVFADRLPAEVFRRPKKGFEVPIAQWLTGPLADMTRRAIDPGRLKAQGLFNSEQPRHWFAQLESGRRDTSEALWTLVAFQAWAERHDNF